MNGYTSANVAPSVNGVKTLVRARGPRALFADLDLLAGAPAELTAAGLGDVLAKTASSADWRLNHLIFGEYYCPYLVELVADLEPLYLNAPQGLRNPSPHTIRPLFEALLLTGAAMTFAGTSAPASGGEHLVSHTLDMRATVTGKAHDLHGRQVGIGTLVATALYDRIRTLESPRFTATSEANADPTYWGGLTGAVDREYARKRQRLVEAVDALNRTPGLWDRVRREVATEVHPPAVLKTCLREAGAAHRFSDIGVGFDEFLAALQHAHQIRERFTVLDLARIAGLWPGCAPEIVEEWLG
jgi:glycerol-1-phosphate dehydrogenase [NAD(P)+]